MDKKRSRPSSKKSTIRPFTAVPTRSERIVELTPAKRLEKEESVMKPEISGPAQIPSGLHPMSQSAVGFETANKHAAKDSVRPPVQQAWESPPTSPKKRISTAIPPYSPGHKRGMKKVENAKDLSYIAERVVALCVRKDIYTRMRFDGAFLRINSRFRTFFILLICPSFGRSFRRAFHFFKVAFVDFYFLV